VQVPARELEASCRRVDIWWRHRPDGRLSGAVPTDPDRTGRRSVPEPVGMLAERATRFSVGHLPAAEKSVQTSRHFMCEPPTSVIGWQPPKGKDREIACRDDVCAVPRPPELDERSIFPGGGLCSLDARVDRKKRRSRHAVLKAGPRRTPQGTRAGREPLVEPTDGSSIRQDLRPREVEPTPRQIRR